MIRPLDILFISVLVLLSVSQMHLWVVLSGDGAAPSGPRSMETARGAPVVPGEGGQDAGAVLPLQAPPLAGVLRGVDGQNVRIEMGSAIESVEIPSGARITLRTLGEAPGDNQALEVGLLDLVSGDQVLVLKNDTGEVIEVIATRPAAGVGR